MTREELNQLRPGDKIIYTAAKQKSLGTVRSIWRDSHMQVRWSGDKQDDTIILGPNGDPYIRRYIP